MARERTPTRIEPVQIPGRRIDEDSSVSPGELLSGPPAQQNIMDRVTESGVGHSVPNPNVSAPTRSHHASVVSSTPGVQAYRPLFRPPIAMLVAVDDGATTGRTFRLFNDRTTIGREGVDIEVPHDGLVSRKHAVIKRILKNSQYRWFLEDEGSRNGTYVRVARTRLKDAQEFLVGSKRFRYSKGTAGSPAKQEAAPAVATTAMWQSVSKEQLDSATPRLVEILPDESDGQVILLARSNTVVGSSSELSDRIDDPYVNPKHFQVTQAKQGRWLIEDLQSKNGIWIRVNRIELTSSCEFQVGEQRLLFQPTL